MKTVSPPWSSASYGLVPDTISDKQPINGGVIPACAQTGGIPPTFCQRVNVKEGRQKKFSALLRLAHS